MVGAAVEATARALKMRWSRWLAACVCTALLGVVGPAVAASHGLILDQAQRHEGSAVKAAQAVTLPDQHPKLQTDGPVTLTYRLAFEREALERQFAGTPSPLLGLLLARACGELTVHINGTTIHRDRDDDAGRTEGCRQHQLLPLPWPLTTAGTNVLTIELQGWPLPWVSTAEHALSLSTVHIGSYSALHLVHRNEMEWAVQLPGFLGGGLLVMAVLAGVLVAFAPREAHLVHYAGLSGSWALILFHSALQWMPDWPAIREGLPVILTAVGAWCHMGLVCTYAGLQVPLMRHVAWAQAALVTPAALLAAGTPHMFTVASIGSVTAIMLMTAATLIFIRHSDEQRLRPMGRLGAVLCVFLLLTTLDMAARQGWTGTLDLTLLRWAVPLALLAMGLLQMAHFGQQVHQLEASRRMLQHKIEQARGEIEANFTQLAEARIQQVTAGERKRIAADLHDDLGAKLLTIVHTSRSDRIAALGREALDEMRLSVRGLTGRPMELSDALADWRTEAVGRLSATGIDLNWPLPEDELPQVLGSRTMVQTTRILREVFNNLIRHSHAQRCDVSTDVRPDRLHIEIRDDGIGFDVERLKDGQNGLGLLSMAHRARQLDGECVIESRLGGGSTVRLSLPLDGTDR